MGDHQPALILSAAGLSLLDSRSFFLFFIQRVRFPGQSLPLLFLGPGCSQGLKIVPLATAESVARIVLQANSLVKCRPLPGAAEELQTRLCPCVASSMAALFSPPRPSGSVLLTDAQSGVALVGRHVFLTPQVPLQCNLPPGPAAGCLWLAQQLGGGMAACGPASQSRSPGPPPPLAAGSVGRRALAPAGGASLVLQLFRVSNEQAGLETPWQSRLAESAKLSPCACYSGAPWVSSVPL